MIEVLKILWVASIGILVCAFSVSVAAKTDKTSSALINIGIAFLCLGLATLVAGAELIGGIVTFLAVLVIISGFLAKRGE